MGNYECGFCQRESCYGCPSYDEYESPAKYYRREGYDEGYDEGYKDGRKKGYEEGYKKGKSERRGLICLFAKPEGTFCKWFEKPCDGCDLSCDYLCVKEDEENHFFYPGKELERK